MKDVLLKIINDYLLLFPEEKIRQKEVIKYLQNHTNEQIIDWNNFNGHIVAGGFVYSKEQNKFLVLYHKDLKMFLYPGGHIKIDDKNPLYAAKREITEETGLNSLEQLILSDNELLPIDIDTHLIEYNKRLDLPKHYHFEFRYLFIVDKNVELKIDNEEISDYKWVDINKLNNDPNYGKIAQKIKILLSQYKLKNIL